MLLPAQVLLSVPVVEAGTHADKPRDAEVRVNRAAPKVQPPRLSPEFSEQPTDLEIRRARVFGEPLVPIGGATTPSENLALAQAIHAYIAGNRTEDVTPFTQFLASRPSSPWRASLLLNLGVVYRRTGYFSRALGAWGEAWRLSKGAADPLGRAVGDASVAELAELNARLGRFETLQELFDEIDARGGAATEKVAGAKQGLWLMLNQPEDAFRCGPMALDRILAYGRSDYQRDARITESRSTSKGMSLVSVRNLANSLGMNVQMAHRQGDAEILLPAVVHWRAGHYAALLQERDGRYLVQDPTFGDELWVSRAALNDETSGYFLVNAGKLPPGWTAVTDKDGSEVWGKGNTNGGDPNRQGCNDNQQGGDGGWCGGTCGGGGGGKGMATYSFFAMMVSLHVMDTPVGYAPPRGPAVQFSVGYSQRDAFQPQIFPYSNLGPKWTFNWFAYIEDDPSNLSASVSAYPSGGGREVYSGFDPVSQSYAVHYISRAILRRVSTSPIQYERHLPDGSKEIYAQPDGAFAFPRKVLLTQIVDPQGQALTFTYDVNLRLVSATDAIGQVTTISYDLGADPLKVTEVTDPFGRSATFDYDADGRLIRITDVIDIESEFSYGAADFIASLTTPYGTTSFTMGENGQNKWLEAVDALGGRERIEYLNLAPIPGSEPVAPAGFTNNSYLNYRNTFYWDKRAMALYPKDYTKARITHWLHGIDINTTGGTIESEKMPLEGRIWYAYAGQPRLYDEGSDVRPTTVARVLDDGQTQVNRYEYNSKGLKTRVTDPLGRETLYEYDTNEIDLLRVKQKNGGSYDLLETRTYNAQHRPLTVTDAAGQVTSYTYNTQGQVLTAVTPPRAGLSQAQRTTTYAYDTNGYLQSVTGPLAGATTSYTYDGYGRMRTVTDADSYTLTYDYDALDRTTKVTYPDSTYEQTVYNRLDPEKQRDRLGRWSEIFYDALRRVVATRDPLGRTTTKQWCSCGSMDRIVDPKGNATSWDRDVQGRVTKETRADGLFWEHTYETTTSRLKKIKDAKGQETQYTYFLDDKVQQVSYPNAQIATPSVSYTYEAAYGRLATIVDGTGTTSYSYHPVAVLGAGQVSSVDGPLTNDTISYGYEELGRVANRTLNGASTTWAYDALHRLTTLGDPLGSFTHAYVGVTGRLSSLTYPNGQTSSYAYLPNSGDKRLQEIHHRVSTGGATLSKFNYTYDTAGSVTQWTQQYGTAAANAYDLGYDAAEQLVSGVYRTTDPTPVVLKRYGYAYDAAGNRATEQIDDAPLQSSFDNRNRLTSQQPGGALVFKGSVNEPATVTVAGSRATVDSANKFQGTAPVGAGTSNVVVTATDPSGNLRTNTYQVTIAGSSKTFTYDANGSLTGEGTKTYEWDGANRLLRILNGGAEVVRFVYDGQGRRSQKVAGAMTWTYVYDTEAILEERLSTGTTIRFVHGQGVDQPLAKVESGAASYHLADHLGSIVQLTNASAAVTLTRQYDSWGNLLQGAETEGYAFTGREWDPEAGLYYYRARYYDPKIGRFSTEDPIGLGGGLNLYRYVENNPSNETDPSGLAPGDKRCGLPPAFWRWYHRQYKDPGDPNIDCATARKLYEYWKTIGSPGPGTIRCIPFIIINPCIIVPAFCECDEDGCIFVGPQGTPPGA